MSSFRGEAPTNVGVVVVPQQQAYIVERFGKYQKVLEPGLQFLIPLVHRIRYVFSLKEEALVVPSQSAVTRDNVNIHIDGVLYVKVVDPYNAAYGVEDPHFAITQLAQTTMRSEIGRLSLDETFLERDRLNASIVEAINAAAADWGIACMRYEIRDIAPPNAVRLAMEMQAEAERRKRALILDAQGEQEATVLASEAAMQERINLAKGEAAAIEAQAAASAKAVAVLAEALRGEGGQEACALRVAEQYVQAFKGLAASGLDRRRARQRSGRRRHGCPSDGGLLRDCGIRPRRWRQQRQQRRWRPAGEGAWRWRRRGRRCLRAISRRCGAAVHAASAAAAAPGCCWVGVVGAAGVGCLIGRHCHACLWARVSSVSVL